MQVTDRRTRQVTADLRVENITSPQNAARPNQNELELEVSVPQMRFGKNSTVRQVVEHIDYTFYDG